MKNILSVAIITLLLLGILESGARLFLSYYLDNANAGVKERNQHLSYRVFTMWGKDLNQLSDEFLENSSENEFRILLLGASTAGEFTDGGHGQLTLENEFSKILPEELSISLFNASVGGFNIRQEAISLLITASKIKPDLILVLDGANDIQHAIRPNVVPGTTYVDNTYKIVLQNPYLGPVVQLIQKSQIYNGLLRYFQRNSFNEDDVSKNLSESINLYINDRQFISDYALGSQTPVIFMLQPYVGFSQDPDDAFAKSRYEYRQKTVINAFDIIDQNSEQLHCYVNSNHSLKDQHHKLNFLDDVHFKDSISYEFMAKLFVGKYRECFKETGDAISSQPRSYP